MFTQIFTIIELVLKAIKLWDLFLGYMDEKHMADILANRAARNAAIDKQKNAQTEKDFDDAQSDIVEHGPH